ncbi:uncharacterized protein LOC101889580 [Musca domestica]|uniref:Uncharacterized protein LOC101889580 n=1 Tax=Musca domestica TaxID=7370 RepID=A0A1I8MCN9_MUSDO|nr:uncharacterized protein LOC101889580 [Musca domestica]
MFGNHPKTVLILFFIQVMKSSNFLLEINNFTCHKYTPRITYVECEYFKFATNHYGLSGRIKFDSNLDRSFKTHVTVNVMPKNSRQNMHIVDLTFNVCVFLKQMLSNQFLRQYALEFKRISNIPSSCPFKKDVVYEAKNFTLTTESIPSYLPYMNFEFKMEFYDKNHIIGMFQVYGGTDGEKK